MDLTSYYQIYNRLLLLPSQSLPSIHNYFLHGIYNFQVFIKSFIWSYFHVHNRVHNWQQSRLLLWWIHRLQFSQCLMWIHFDGYHEPFHLKYWQKLSQCDNFFEIELTLWNLSVLLLTKFSIEHFYADLYYFQEFN